MKTTRKMILVDFNTSSNHHIPKKEIDTQPKPLYILDDEIGKILDSEENINDKLRKYFYALNRFLFFKSNSSNENVINSDLKLDDLVKFESKKKMDHDDEADEQRRKTSTISNESSSPSKTIQEEEKTSISKSKSNSKKRKKKEKAEEVKRLRSPIKTRGFNQKQLMYTEDDSDNFQTPDKTITNWISPFK